MRSGCPVSRSKAEVEECRILSAGDRRWISGARDSPEDTSQVGFRHYGWVIQLNVCVRLADQEHSVLPRARKVSKVPGAGVAVRMNRMLNSQRRVLSDHAIAGDRDVSSPVPLGRLSMTLKAFNHFHPGDQPPVRITVLGILALHRQEGDTIPAFQTRGKVRAVAYTGN